VQRPLRERRERPQRLDLVTEELDPDRLAPGRREDVHDPAANGELPALLGLRHPLVAGEREALRQRLDARLVADAQDDRLGTRAHGRDPLRRPDRGGADQASGREHLEGAGALADEVRRRLEPAPPAHAARGEEADPLLAEVPARRLGGVAGVPVVGEDADERPAASVVEGREEQREQRLGDARRARLLEKPEQALAAGQLAGERCQRGGGCAGRPVHDERRNPGFRGVIVAPRAAPESSGGSAGPPAPPGARSLRSSTGSAEGWRSTGVGPLRRAEHLRRVVLQQGGPPSYAGSDAGFDRTPMGGCEAPLSSRYRVGTHRLRARSCRMRAGARSGPRAAR
jgi:hypothetical protein